MVTRVIELITAPQSSGVPYQRIDEKVRQVLRLAPGFVDQIILVSEVEPRLVILLSLWKSGQAAARYDQEFYPRICATLSASTAEGFAVLTRSSQSQAS
jgi:hypothetical protein